MSTYAGEKRRMRFDRYFEDSLSIRRSVNEEFPLNGEESIMSYDQFGSKEKIKIDLKKTDKFSLVRQLESIKYDSLN